MEKDLVTKEKVLSDSDDDVREEKNEETVETNGRMIVYKKENGQEERNQREKSQQENQKVTTLKERKDYRIDGVNPKALIVNLHLKDGVFFDFNGLNFLRKGEGTRKVLLFLVILCCILMFFFLDL